MNPRFALIVLGVLIAVLVAVAAFFALQSGSRGPNATSTQATTSSTNGSDGTGSTAEQPLSARVSVTSPAADATVAHTFTVKGQAPGAWFFEASFPVQVRDNAGDVVGRAIAQASPPAGGDWMTTGLVPFETSVTVSGYSGPAMLILLRDNPSGLPENDDAVSIPIIIK